jgi:hypothetical protein
MDFKTVMNPVTVEISDAKDVQGQVVALDDKALAVRRLEDYRGDVVAVVDSIKELEVVDDASNREMTQYISIAAKLVKALGGAVDTLIAPAKAHMSFVKNFGKGFTDPLSVQISAGKIKLGSYASRLELERRKDEALLRRQHEERQAELDRDAKKAGVAKVTLPPPVIKREEKTATQTTEGKTSVSYKWNFKVVDADKVPREYCSPDTGKLRDAVKAGMRNIDGVAITKDAQVRVYTS